MKAIILLTISLFSLSNINCQNCENGWYRFKDKCFWKRDFSATRYENERICKSMNAELVSIHSKEENDFIRTFASGHHFYNLGAYRVQVGRREFRWSDGSQWGFTAWGWCEPNNIYNFGSNCTVVFTGPRIQWFDEDCRMRRFQMCQKNLQQTLRPTTARPEIQEGLQALKRELNDIKKLQTETLQELKQFERNIKFNISEIKNRREGNKLPIEFNASQAELKSMLTNIKEKLEVVDNKKEYEKISMFLHGLLNTTMNVETKVSKLSESDNFKKIEDLHKNTVESLSDLFTELLTKKSNENEETGFKRLHDRLTTIIEKLTEEREEWRKKENTSFEILAKLLKKIMEQDSELEERRRIDFKLQQKL